MRPEGSPLDLNNLPQDFNFRDGKLQATSSTVAGRKKNGAKDEPGKVYECRFCSLRFCKSQALGGHMNRHRQERETETLNKARQLVFTNDLVPGHLGFPPWRGGYPQSESGNGPPLPLRGMYYSYVSPPSFPSLYSAAPPPRQVGCYLVSPAVGSSYQRQNEVVQEVTVARKGQDWQTFGTFLK